MRKVIVVGGGPAGLGAAERLLTEGDVAVTLLTLECNLGGNASSWTAPDGRVVEQGQHIMMGFYQQMRALLGRAGVDPEATTVPNGGHVVIWEDRDQRAHHLHLGASTPGALVDGLAYTGFTLREKAGFAVFFARAAAEVSRGVPESADDTCLTAWCLEKGLPASVVTSRGFEATRVAQFNWPGEISAYSVLQTLRELGRDFTTCETRFPAGSMSDIWWEPIGRHIERLGGKLLRPYKLTGLHHQAGRLCGLEFARPVPHAASECFLEQNLALAPEREMISGFDAVILAIPPGSVQELLARDLALAALPGLSGIPRLKTVVPMGLHVWHRNTVTAPRTLVCGLPHPLSVAVDNKPLHPSYRDDPSLGAVLHFVGQETLFEDWSDEDLLHRCLAGIRRVPGYEAMTDEGVLVFQVVRDRAPHRRYWYSEPGSLRFKPHPKTPLSGLWLAGDWVRSRADFPCMETAVRSGREVAAAVLDELAAWA